MGISSHLKGVWRRLGKADAAFFAAAALYLVAKLLDAGLAVQAVLLFVLVGTASVAGIKWARAGIRKLIWRLRNRLMVAYLFIAAVPILLIGILMYGFSSVTAGQVSAYLVSSELDRRLGTLEALAEALARTPRQRREGTWAEAERVFDGMFPAVDAVVEDGDVTRFPPDSEAPVPPEEWRAVTGIIARDGELYAWARAVNGSTVVTMTAPATRQFFRSLSPGIGDVTILEGSNREHAPMPGEQPALGSAVPPAKNRFDFSFIGGTNIPVANWHQPQTEGEGGILGIHGRFSAFLDLIFRQETSAGDLRVYLAAAAIVFLIVELVSLILGISITRTITGAFNDLYVGTERVRQGDFSYRTEVRGDDQLAVVNDSFNRMTENIERLLVVSKEKERMQTELEIAQAVQQQLYPKTAPVLEGLELLARCNPARMVSGDYYDYQALGEKSAVIAVGDVAGKGISAALLMATLQSSLRTQVRACLDGDGGGQTGMSTSKLVSQLNEQVYSDTSPEKYATFLFSVYDDESGVLTYTNAGHLPPVLFRKGTATELDVNGMVVGAFPFAQYGESKLRLESGDVLLAFTDGITEPENEYGEMFGEKRVMDTVLKNAHRDLDQVMETVMEEVGEWTGSPELQDDMTILIARKR